MTYSTLKLNQVASRCGSTISGEFLGQLLADPRYSRYQIAAAMSIPLVYFEMAMAEPEPTVYDPMTSHDEQDQPLTPPTCVLMDALSFVEPVMPVQPIAEDASTHE